jgi:hypothetical protein
MTLEDCAAETTRIEAEETAAGVRQALAGFDLTFSVPKSVSVLWGIADAATPERIVDAHHAAVADVLDFFEREVAATRTGIADHDGAVAQVEVAGVVADLERLVPRVVVQHGLDDADDVAAVLKYRVDKVASAPPRGKRGLQPRLVAGLIPEPLGAMSVEDRQAIAERKQLIESRARALAEQALASGAPWTRRLGTPPHDATDRERWLDAVTTVAAYRDRYDITSNLTAGGGATNDAQQVDRQSALQAARSASAATGGQRGRAQSVEVPSLSSP